MTITDTGGSGSDDTAHVLGSVRLLGVRAIEGALVWLVITALVSMGMKP
jgi:hypothetical protein